MKANNFNYTQVPLDSCFDLATSLDREGRKVHFHVLPPNCRLNPRPEGYAFVVEDSSRVMTYLAFSEDFPEVNNRLLATQYDESMLDESLSRLGDPDFVESSAILKKAVELTEIGLFWHHHVHTPDCIFNSSMGLYVIVIEQQLDGVSEISVESFEDEPKEIIREIEILYFKNNRQNKT